MVTIINPKARFRKEINLNTFPRPARIVHICDLSTGEAEGFESESQPGCTVSFRPGYIVRPCLNQKERKYCLFDRLSSLYPLSHSSENVFTLRNPGVFWCVG